MEGKKIIDLHMHSVNSDGSKTIDELLNEFERLQIDIASFTDHDSVKGYFDLERSEVKLSKEVMIIPGVELSFAYNGELRDMLGYGIDIQSIDNFIEERYSKEERIKKQRSILEKFKNNCRNLKLKFDEDIEVVTGNKAEAYILVYTSLNKYEENLENYPFIKENRKFYWEYFANKNTPFFVDETIGLPTIEEVVKVIHNAGGLAFLAHPFGYGISKNNVLDLIHSALESKIDGIEVKHSTNKNDDVEVLKDIANKNNRYMSGGSDFHGSTKPDLHLVTGYENMIVEYDDIKPWLDKVNSIKRSNR